MICWHWSEKQIYKKKKKLVNRTELLFLSAIMKTTFLVCIFFFENFRSRFFSCLAGNYNVYVNI